MRVLPFGSAHDGNVIQLHAKNKQTGPGLHHGAHLKIIWTVQDEPCNTLLKIY